MKKFFVIFVSLINFSYVFAITSTTSIITNATSTKIITLTSSTNSSTTTTAKVVPPFVISTSTIKTIMTSTIGTCRDFKKNFYRYQESMDVMYLQSFLFEKGYLKVKPNGYFGVGTFGAVKAYQKDKGLPSVGHVGPATRAIIKSETCGDDKIQVNKITIPTSSSSTKETFATSTVYIASTTIPSPVSPQDARNARRKDDLGRLLRAMYNYFVDSRGVHVVYTTATPLELCVKPKILVDPNASTTEEVAVLVTPESPCKDYIDIAYLSPSYLLNIPRDPSLATSSTLIGYTITRSENNDITLSVKNSENGAIIKATCNFNSYCKEIQYITSIVYDKPILTSLNRTIIIKNTTAKTPLIIKGSGFTGKNKINLFSGYDNKTYYLGEFSSVSSTTIEIPSNVTNQAISCGPYCSQNLPLGDYVVTLENEGGKSNPLYLTIKPITTSSISIQADSPVLPETNNVKVGTISISSTIPITLTSLTLNSTSTSKNLSSKITHFVLKDQATGAIYGGPVFSLGGVKLYENQSKVYDVYIDVVEVLNEDTGFITYGGAMLVNDPLFSTDIEVPIKEFSFTVSH